MNTARRVVFLCGLLAVVSQANGQQGKVSLNGLVSASLATDVWSPVPVLTIRPLGGQSQVLPMPSGYTNCTSLGGISWDGRVVVGTCVTPNTNRLQSAVVWRDGQPIVVGDLPGGTHVAEGAAVSGNGQVVVGAGRDEQSLQAFRWTQEDGFEPLGPAFGIGTVPVATNFDASVIVGYAPSGGSAWIWRQSSGYQFLPSPGGSFALALDCSEDGRVVVGFYTRGGNEQAVVWQDGVMIEVPPLDGRVARRAIAVSADGRRVSGYYVQGPCFLWDPTNGASYLGSVITSQNLPFSVGDGCMQGMSKDGRWFPGGSRGLNAPCAGDVDGGAGNGARDAAVTTDDLLAFVQWIMDGNVLADIDDGSGTGTPDAAVTIDDLLYFLEGFESGC
jgi:hypothetical protein